MEEVKFILPLEIEIPRKTKPPKKIRINKNVERNLNRFTYKRAKEIFSQLLYKSFRESNIPSPPLSVSFTFYHGNNRKVDLDNYSVIAKFAIDALKDHGCITDDNIDIIKHIEFWWGGVDKAKPRAEMTIKRIVVS